MEKCLKKIYHHPRSYWKEFDAIKKLSEAAKVSKDVAKKWLWKQALWQIYLPAPRQIPRPKFVVPTPNTVYQADKLGRKVFKYALTVETEPLTSKISYEVT